jgi:CO/xanthine dehydrogenase FAD-binding subunit
MAAADAGPGPFAAGCTVLLPAWLAAEPATLTDITALPEAKGVTFDGRLRIGALETIERCRNDPLIARHAPLLAQACGVIGALGVRLLGTLGGNIGWRQGDTIPALLALGAAVETPAGTIPLEDALQLSELPLLLAIVLPPQRGVAVYEKTGHRAAFSPSVATVAGCVDAGKARLAASAAGQPGQRLPHAEAMLEDALRRGTLPDQAALAAAIGPNRIAGRVLSGLLLAVLA